MKAAQPRLDGVMMLVGTNVDSQIPALPAVVHPASGSRTPSEERNELHDQSGHRRAWAEKIASFDAFEFVTPEYNHGTSGALKNAIDFLYAEWNNKAAGFVSYGSAGGTRAVEHLRGVMAELQIADVRAQVMLSLSTDFENFSTFKPGPNHAKSVTTMLDQVIAWGGAMKTLRQ